MQLMQLNAIAKEASAKPRKNLNRRWTRADPKCNLTYFSFPFPCCIPTYSAVVYLPRSVKQKSSKYSESRLHLIRKRVFLLLFFLVFCKVIFSPGFMFFNVAYRKMNNIAQKKNGGVTRWVESPLCLLQRDIRFPVAFICAQHDHPPQH